jgi:hypothetical protein
MTTRTYFPASPGAALNQRARTGAAMSRAVPPALVLQRSIGNQGMQRLLRPSGIQAKLSVSQPNDPFEQEAERVAGQVLRMPAPESESPCPACASGLSRCPTCAARKTQTPGVQTAASINSDHPLRDLGPGRPLDTATRAFFEPRFGHDFGHVRVHDDHPSAQSARSMNARAYTLGHDVVFDTGQYAPRANAGRQLLAHELAHVVQQGASPAPGATPVGPISRVARPSIQRRVRFFVCDAADQTQVNAARGLPTPATAAALRAAADTASSVAALWAANAALLLRFAPAGVRSAFRDAFGQNPEWVPPWFATLGVRWTNFGDLVAERLLRVSQILGGGWIQYYCWGSPTHCPECTDSPPAYDACSSYRGQYLICLGPGFWQLWAAGNTDHMALILLHEAMHIYFSTTVAHSGRSGNAFCFERFVAEANGRSIQPGDAAACPTAP